MTAADRARLLAACPLGCGQPRHPMRRCDGSAIDWAARAEKARAWVVAQQAEHEKAHEARQAGRHYTARRIAYEVER